MTRFHGVVGLVAILAFAFLFSTKRSAIQKRIVIWGVVLQFAFAFLVLKTKLGEAFYAVSLFVNALLNYSSAGARFVFGDQLGLKEGQFGVIFAFLNRGQQVLALLEMLPHAPFLQPHEPLDRLRLAPRF